MKIPDKTEAYFLIEMIESNLLTSRHLQPWADGLIEQADVPPAWICDLSITRYQPDLAKIVRGYVYELEIVRRPAHLEKFHVGCLWLRYVRKELSWSTLLQNIGGYLDADGVDWGCEIAYEHLNTLEGSGYSSYVERKTREEYLSQIDIKPYILMANKKYREYVNHDSVQQDDVPERFAPDDP